MKKSTLIMILSLVLAVALGVGGTLAYLTDDDGDVNVMVVGNVQITQNEQQRVDQGEENSELEEFEQNKAMAPIVDKGMERIPQSVNGWDITMRDEDTYRNYVDKIVSVTNTGSSDAYVRTLLAFPTKGYDSGELAFDEWLHWNYVSDTDTTPNNGWMWGTEANGVEYPNNTKDWNAFYNVEINGEEYTVYIATNVDALAPGKTTAPTLVGMFLDAAVDNELVDGKINYYVTKNGKKFDLGDISKLEVLVLSQAVQADGFDTAWEAFDAAFPTDEDAVVEWMSAIEQGTPGEKWPSNNPPEAGSIYVTNEEELKAALADEEITKIIFGDDITIDEVITVDSDVVIDLNGYDIDASALEGRPFDVTDGAKLTINAEGSEVKMGSYGLVNVPDGNDAEITLNGGKYVGELANGSLIRARGTGEIVVNLNDIEYEDTSSSQDGWIVSCDASEDQNLEVNVSGGDYTAPRGFNVGFGSLNMTGTEMNMTDTVQGYAVATYNKATIEDSTINTKFRSLAVGYQGTIEVKDSTVVSENDHALYAFTTGGTLDISNSTVEGNGSNGAYYFNQPKSGYYAEVIIDGTSVYKKDNR